MVEYIFVNNTGVYIPVKTDAIDLTTENFTIMQVNGSVGVEGLSNGVQSTIGKSLDRTQTTKQTLVSLATTWGYSLLAKVIGGDGTNQNISLRTLAVPGSLAGTVNSATQITVTWTKSTNATGYVLQRATNAGFTTGLTSFTLGDVATKVDTDLTTATQYWYRIKATGINFTDSANSASINRTTS